MATGLGLSAGKFVFIPTVVQHSLTVFKESDIGKTQKKESYEPGRTWHNACQTQNSNLNLIKLVHSVKSV